MLKLRSKTCHIGPSINTRVQRRDEEREPYLDIPITISLTAKELAAITGDAHIPDAWFQTKDGKLTDPLLKGWAPYGLSAQATAVRAATPRGPVMNPEKRRARAKRRAKTMRLRRDRGIPCHASKWGWMSSWNGGGLTPGEVQSIRKKVRRGDTHA